MKILRLLLAFYIAALTVVPCSDATSCTDEVKAHDQMSSVSALEQAENGVEVCTPFCICACCATHINLSPLADLDFDLVVHNTQVAIPYIEKKGLTGHSQIWQPPRV